MPSMAGSPLFALSPVKPPASPPARKSPVEEKTAVSFSALSSVKPPASPPTRKGQVEEHEGSIT